MVKRLPAMRETRLQSLGWEDPLEKEMATHSSTHAWKIPWMEKPGGPELERKPEVPASTRDEALFHCDKPSGVPRGPSNSSVSLILPQRL